MGSSSLLYLHGEMYDRKFIASYVPELCDDCDSWGNFRETRVKTVLSISSDGELLTYNQSRLFEFSQETTRPGLQEADTICTINIALVVSVATF